MVTPDDIIQWIEAALPKSQVVATGDGRHFEIRVVGEQFEGKNKIARHRLVYQALGRRMEKDIHALSINAMTPEEHALEMEEI